MHKTLQDLPNLFEKKISMKSQWLRIACERLLGSVVTTFAVYPRANVFRFRATKGPTNGSLVLESDGQSIGF